MKRTALFLALIGLGSTGLMAGATALDQPYSISIGGDYGKPFGSAGFSGSVSDAYGADLSFEYKAADWLGLGLKGSYTQIAGKTSSSSDTINTNLQSSDLYANVRPLPAYATVLPYAQAGIGWQYADADRAGSSFKPGMRLEGGLGLRAPLGDAFLVDLGGFIQYYQDSNGLDVKTGLARLAVGYGFGDTLLAAHPGVKEEVKALFSPIAKPTAIPTSKEQVKADLDGATATAVARVKKATEAIKDKAAAVTSTAAPAASATAVATPVIVQ